MFKSVPIILLLLGFFVNCNAKKDGVVDIINLSSKNKNYQALSEKIDFRALGRMGAGDSLSSSFNYNYLLPDKQRLRITAGMLIIDNLILGNEGWHKRAHLLAVPISEYDRNYVNVIRNAVMPDIYGYKKAGDSVISVANERVSGVDCYKINLIKKTGSEVTSYFFASDDYRIVKMSKNVEINSEPILIEVFYDSYTKYEDIRIPTKIESYFGDKLMKFRIDYIYYNSGLSDNEFGKPN